MTWLFNQEYATNMYIKEREQAAKAEGARETARYLYGIGLSLEQIAGAVSFSVETVCKWLGIPVTDGSISS